MYLTKNFLLTFCVWLESSLWECAGLSDEAIFYNESAPISYILNCPDGICTHSAVIMPFCLTLIRHMCCYIRISKHIPSGPLALTCVLFSSNLGI